MLLLPTLLQSFFILSGVCGSNPFGGASQPCLLITLFRYGYFLFYSFNQGCPFCCAIIVVWEDTIAKVMKFSFLTWVYGRVVKGKQENKVY